MKLILYAGLVLIVIGLLGYMDSAYSIGNCAKREIEVDQTWQRFLDKGYPTGSSTYNYAYGLYMDALSSNDNALVQAKYLNIASISTIVAGIFIAIVGFFLVKKNQ